jgi:organic hydroperoxide reductase OsmC/OhrA
MVETDDGGGHFVEATLRPVVTVKDASMVELARALHVGAEAHCFIAQSVNFPVHHEPTVLVGPGAEDVAPAASPQF